MNGYMAEEVFPVPIVPVINTFWYKPFSGIMTGKDEFLFFPIVSDKLVVVLNEFLGTLSS